MAKQPGRTLEQKLAAAQAKAASLKHRLSESRRKAETREKIVIGGTVLAAMADDPHFRRGIIGILRQRVTREIDKAAIAHLLDEHE